MKTPEEALLVLQIEKALELVGEYKQEEQARQRQQYVEALIDELTTPA